MDKIVDNQEDQNFIQLFFDRELSFYGGEFVALGRYPVLKRILRTIGKKLFEELSLNINIRVTSLEYPGENRFSIEDFEIHFEGFGVHYGDPLKLLYRFSWLPTRGFKEIENNTNINIQDLIKEE